MVGEEEETLEVALATGVFFPPEPAATADVFLPTTQSSTGERDAFFGDGTREEGPPSTSPVPGDAEGTFLAMGVLAGLALATGLFAPPAEGEGETEPPPGDLEVFLEGEAAGDVFGGIFLQVSLIYLLKSDEMEMIHNNVLDSIQVRRLPTPLHEAGL